MYTTVYTYCACIYTEKPQFREKALNLGLFKEISQLIKRHALITIFFLREKHTIISKAAYCMHVLYIDLNLSPCVLTVSKFFFQKLFTESSFYYPASRVVWENYICRKKWRLCSTRAQPFFNSFLNRYSWMRADSFEGIYSDAIFFHALWMCAWQLLSHKRLSLTIAWV